MALERMGDIKKVLQPEPLQEELPLSRSSEYFKNNYFQ